MLFVALMLLSLAGRLAAVFVGATMMDDAVPEWWVRLSVCLALLFMAAGLWLTT